MSAAAESEVAEAGAKNAGLERGIDWTGAFWVASGVPPLVLFSIGATLGCSRPIADAGWLPKSRQVGQSGKTASACKLYIAMGVSGAIQHLAGMKHVSTIVAVNTDAEASIFGVAKYGIVGDIFEIAEELRRLF